MNNLVRTAQDSMMVWLERKKSRQRETENREAAHRTATHFTILLRHTLTHNIKHDNKYTLNNITSISAFSACVWDDFEGFSFLFVPGNMSTDENWWGIWSANGIQCTVGRFYIYKLYGTITISANLQFNNPLSRCFSNHFHQSDKNNKNGTKKKRI